MPFVGQNIFNSSIVNSRERTLNTMQNIRSGQWGRLAPENTPGGKYFASKNLTTEVVRSGRKFQGNFKDKLSEANQKSISGFLQRKQILDQQG